MSTNDLAALFAEDFVSEAHVEKVREALREQAILAFQLAQQAAAMINEEKAGKAALKPESLIEELG